MRSRSMHTDSTCGPETVDIRNTHAILEGLAALPVLLCSHPPTFFDSAFKHHDLFPEQRIAPRACVLTFFQQYLEGRRLSLAG